MHPVAYLGNKKKKKLKLLYYKLWIFLNLNLIYENKYFNKKVIKFTPNINCRCIFCYT